MLLKKLVECWGVSGDEGEIRNFIKGEISSYCDEVKIDRMGNLIAVKKGKRTEKKVMLCAHMDEVGLIVTGIGDNGMIRFHTIGGMDDRVLVSKRVSVGPERIPGVIGAKAIHLQERDERTKALKQRQLYIDIGVKNKEAAEKFVHLGDYVSFCSDYVEFGEDRIKAKALDDRAGCAILMEMLKGRYDFTLVAAFTVQEEVGLRGAGVAAYHVEPDLALVVETTTCSDVAGVDEHFWSTRLGMGPALSIMDRTSIADKRIVSLLADVAEQNDIPYQYKQSGYGGNDAGRIHISRGGVPTASVSVPCRYIHSPVSVMSKKDFEDCGKLVGAFLDNAGRLL